MEDDAADLVTIDQALMTTNNFGFRTDNYCILRAINMQSM